MKVMTSEPVDDPGAADAPDRIDPMRAAVPQLHARLRRLIIRGELSPGTRIVRRDLAARYTVSRQPIGEACNRLAEEGLLDVFSQRGTYVSRIDIDAVLSARFVLEAVEVDMACLLAARLEPEVITRLERIVEAQAALVDSPEPAPFVELDDAFHRGIALAAGQGRAHEALQAIRVQLDRLRHLLARRSPRAPAVDQHRRIVAALRARDTRAVETAMREHQRRMLDGLQDAVDARPDDFDGRPVPP